MTKYVYKTREYLKEESLSDDEYLEHFNLPKINMSGVKKTVNSLSDNFNKAKKSFNKMTKNAGKALDKAADTIEDTASDIKKKATKSAKKLTKKIDREWKKHKWVARKRDKNGKWIYDYGNGFPGEKNKTGGQYSLEDVNALMNQDYPGSKNALSIFDTTDPSDIADTKQISKGLKFLNTLGHLGRALSELDAKSAIASGASFLTDIGAYTKGVKSKLSKVGDKVDPKTGLRLKKKKTSKEEDLRDTNPGYGLSDGTRNNNCYACTLAYDLRKRGYDVTAVDDSNGANMNTMSQFYKGANPKIFVNDENTDQSVNYFDDNGIYHNKALTNELKTSLNKEPDGSSGYMMIKWTSGGGHAVAYEKENGNTVIYDAQTGQKVKIDDYIDTADSVGYFRTDNLEINYDAAKKVVE